MDQFGGGRERLGNGSGATSRLEVVGPQAGRRLRRAARRLRRAAAIFAVLVLLAAGYGTFIEPRLILDVEEEAALIPGLPRAWHGERVALISDLQVGMWLGNVDMARKAVEEAVERRPAAAMVTGDFVYGDGDLVAKVRTAVRVVEPLVGAGIPTFAVLGNHDHAAGAAPLLIEALEEAGISVLHNEATELPAPDGGGAQLYMVGIGAERPGEARPETALADVPDDAPRLVMMHNPASFGALPAGAAPVAVAGHTHGGQIRVPFMPEWSLLNLVEDHPVHADGWIDGYGARGNKLYVNRGIGMSILPMRVNCPPELTVFVLASP